MCGIRKSKQVCSGIPKEDGYDADGLPEPYTVLGMDDSARKKYLSNRNQTGGMERKTEDESVKIRMVSEN